MEEKWKKNAKFACLYGAGFYSFLVGGLILYEIYGKGLYSMSPRTLTFLAIALIFTWMAMLVLAYDFYKKK